MSAYDGEQQHQHGVGGGAVVLGDRNDLHVGDYVGFERIAPTRDWKLSLGKIISFPTTRTVKVALFDATNHTSVTVDPASEAAVEKAAAKEGRMDIWHNREALREEHRRVQAKEQEATQRLFSARDVTTEKFSDASEKIVATLEALDAARRSLRGVPARQWRDLRTAGRPDDDIVRVIRSIMLVLYEDSVVEWGSMQEILRSPDFMDRVLGWDCTVTPMSLPRRRNIAALCAGEDEETKAFGAKKRRRSDTGRQASPPITLTNPKSGTFAALDNAARAWLSAQVACSEAAREQECIINDCFVEQQAQRVQMREINDMRVEISTLEVHILELKNAILGIEDAPKPLMPLDAYPVDSIFYKRTYPDVDGRLVQEIILRESIIINFGPMAEEDADGYVRLNQAQAEYLRTAIINSNVRHDAEEMEDLLMRKEEEEAELAELKARIDALRAKGSLTAEEEEELAQLEKLYANAMRRHQETLARIADLYACGRGAREITMATKRPEFRYTRLHCRMSGDWQMILDDPECYRQMVAAFREDLSELLNIPADYVMDIDARSGSLLIDFTVKHNGERDDDELQDLVNHGKFSALCLFYEKVTFKKTSPLNTSEQIAEYERSLRMTGPLPISGMGVMEQLSDYYNADGTLDEEYSDEVKNDVDYRKAAIIIPPVREDYDEYVITGPVERYTDEDKELPQSPAATQRAPQSAAKAVDGGEDEDGQSGMSPPRMVASPEGISSDDGGITDAAGAAGTTEEAGATLSQHSKSSSKKTSPRASRKSSKTSSKGAPKGQFADEL